MFSTRSETDGCWGGLGLVGDSGWCETDGRWWETDGRWCESVVGGRRTSVVGARLVSSLRLLSSTHATHQTHVAHTLHTRCTHHVVHTSDVVTKWPAMHKWSAAYLESRYAHVKFAVGGVDMLLGNFLRYASSGAYTCICIYACARLLPVRIRACVYLHMYTCICIYACARLLPVRPPRIHILNIYIYMIYILLYIYIYI